MAEAARDQVVAADSVVAVHVPVDSVVEEALRETVDATIRIVQNAKVRMA